MIRRLRSLALALTILVPAVLTTNASEANAIDVRVGPDFGINIGNAGFGTGANVDPYFGVDGWIGIFDITETIQLNVNPGFTIYIPGNNVRMFSFDINAPFLFRVGSDVVAPYALAGFGIRSVSVKVPANPFFGGVGNRVRDTDAVFNLGGGALFLPDGLVNPFVEMKAALGSGSTFHIGAGVLFHF